MKVTWSILSQFQIHLKWTFKRDFDLSVLVHFNMFSPIIENIFKNTNVRMCWLWRENLVYWLTKNKTSILMSTSTYCKLLIISLYGKLWSISFVMSTITLKWILGPTSMFVGVEVLKPKLWIIFFMYNTMQKRGGL
jgi:hypothetical protein